MRVRSFALALVMVAVLGADDAPSPTIVQAQRNYEQQMAAAEAQYRQAIRAAQQEYLQKLKQALELALKSKNRDEANELSAEIKEVELLLDGKRPAGAPLDLLDMSNLVEKYWRRSLAVASKRVDVVSIAVGGTQ